MKKKILALILARSGSKRIKNKNIKLLQNKPLINWTIDLAVKSKVFINIIVSSDSQKILKVVKKNNKDIITLKRPLELALDKSSSEVAALHAIKWYEKKFSKIDYIALLQPTSPFRSLETINKGIEEITKPKINAVVSVKKSKRKDQNNKKLFYLTRNNFCKQFKTKYLADNSYVINGSLYLIQKNFFFSKLSFSPPIFRPIIVKSKKENIDIDTNEDWLYAESFENS